MTGGGFDYMQLPAIADRLKSNSSVGMGSGYNGMMVNELNDETMGIWADMLQEGVMGRVCLV